MTGPVPAGSSPEFQLKSEAFFSDRGRYLSLKGEGGKDAGVYTYGPKWGGILNFFSKHFGKDSYIEFKAKVGDTTQTRYIPKDKLTEWAATRAVDPSKCGILNTEKKGVNALNVSQTVSNIFSDALSRRVSFPNQFIPNADDKTLEQIFTCPVRSDGESSFIYLKPGIQNPPEIVDTKEDGKMAIFKDEKGAAKGFAVVDASANKNFYSDINEFKSNNEKIYSLYKIIENRSEELSETHRYALYHLVKNPDNGSFRRECVGYFEDGNKTKIARNYLIENHKEMKEISFNIEQWKKNDKTKNIYMKIGLFGSMIAGTNNNETATADGFVKNNLFIRETGATVPLISKDNPVTEKYISVPNVTAITLIIKKRLGEKVEIVETKGADLRVLPKDPKVLIKNEELEINKFRKIFITFIGQKTHEGDQEGRYFLTYTDRDKIQTKSFDDRDSLKTFLGRKKLTSEEMEKVNTVLDKIVSLTDIQVARSEQWSKQKPMLLYRLVLDSSLKLKQKYKGSEAKETYKVEYIGFFGKQECQKRLKELQKYTSKESSIEYGKVELTSSQDPVPSPNKFHSKAEINREEDATCIKADQAPLVLL